MTPAHGCCPKAAPEEPCHLCKFGTTPREMQVVLAGMTPLKCLPTGTDCANFNDTFTLTKWAPRGCFWVYSFPASGFCQAAFLTLELFEGLGTVYINVEITRGIGALAQVRWISELVGLPVDCGFSGESVAWQLQHADF